MSRILDIKKNLSNIPDIIMEYENKLKNWKDNVKIDGKNIEVANVEQSSWLAYYDEIKVELKSVVDYFDYLLKAEKAKTLKFLYNNFEKSVSDRTMEKLAEDNKEYKKIFMLYLEIKELYMLADSIVNQIIQRSYSLTNIVKIREKELEGVTLHQDL